MTPDDEIDEFEFFFGKAWSDGLPMVTPTAERLKWMLAGTKRDPEEPVGNVHLTFDVVYQKVLRTYYLLYPAMNKQGFPLNNEEQVAANADPILRVTEPEKWMCS